MDRVNGWAEVLQWFGDPEGGVRPKLLIHERCARPVEMLPALQHDPSRPEDVLKADADEDDVGRDEGAGHRATRVAWIVRRSPPLLGSWGDRKCGGG